MNAKQQKILRIGIIVMLLIGLFPPWIDTLYTEKYNAETPRGYSLLFSPPEAHTHGAYGIKIDITRLVIQWLLAGGVIYLLYNQARNKS